MSDFGLQIAADKLAEALLPDDQMRQERANEMAIRHDGRADPNALPESVLVHRVDFHIDGEAANGSNVAQQFDLYQSGVLKKIVANAKTAPTGSAFVATIVSGVTPITSISIPAGQARSVALGDSQEVPSGGPLRINVTSDAGAADVTITVFYSVR